WDAVGPGGFHMGNDGGLGGHGGGDLGHRGKAEDEGVEDGLARGIGDSDDDGGGGVGEGGGDRPGEGVVGGEGHAWGAGLKLGFDTAFFGLDLEGVGVGLAAFDIGGRGGGDEEEIDAAGGEFFGEIKLTNQEIVGAVPNGDEGPLAGDQVDALVKGKLAVLG